MVGSEVSSFGSASAACCKAKRTVASIEGESRSEEALTSRPTSFSSPATGRRRTRVWRSSRPETRGARELGRQQPGLGQAFGQQRALGHVARQRGAGFQPRQGQHQQPAGGLQPLDGAAEPEQIIRQARGQMRCGQEFHMLRRLGRGWRADEHARLVGIQYP